MNKKTIHSPIDDGFEPERIIKQLRTMMILTMIACGLFGGIVLLFQPLTPSSVSIAAPIFLLAFISLIILKLGRIKLATHIFMFGAWVVFTFVNWTYFGGLDSQGLGLYILIIITVGLTLGQRKAIMYSFLSLLSIVLFYLGHISGYAPIPSSPISYIRKLNINAMYFIMTALLVQIAVSSIKDAFQIAKFNGKNLEARNKELDAIRRELQERVYERTKEIFKQKQLFESLVHHGPIAVVTLDTEHRITACNPAFEKLFGYTQKEVINKDLDDLINDSQTHSEAKGYTNRVKNGEPIRATARRVRKDRSYVEVEIFGIPVIYDGECIGLFAIYHDITEQKAIQSALIESEERYRSLFENSPISLWEEDFSGIKIFIDQLKKQGVINYYEYFSNNPESIQECVSKIKIININQASVEIYKAKSKDDLLSGLMKLSHGNSFMAFRDEFIALAEGRKEFSTEISTKNYIGEDMHISVNLAIAPGYEDDWSKIFVTVVDITERKIAENRLDYLSKHDPLTDLANRSLFYDRLGHALEIAKRELKRIAVLFIDLDQFKRINDTFGHDYGDILLYQIAQRIKSSVRSCDTVARIGGDEFTIVLENIYSRDDALSVANKIILSLEKPFSIVEEQIQIDCSIGISLFPEHGDTVEDLLRKADNAMYKSKKYSVSYSHFYN